MLKLKINVNDSDFVIETLSGAKERVLREELDRQKAEAEEQIAKVIEAIQKYTEKFAKRNVEYDEERGEFYRVREDGKGYYPKPWRIWLDFETMPNEFTLGWLEDNGWELLETSENDVKKKKRYFIVPRMELDWIGKIQMRLNDVKSFFKRLRRDLNEEDSEQEGFEE